MLLKDKNIIITGTNRGIGKAILTQCAKEGANIYAHSRLAYPEHMVYCNELRSKYNCKINNVFFDAKDEEQIKSAIFDLSKVVKIVDGLVNVISYVDNKQNFQMTSINTIKNEFDVNLFSTILISQYISRIMSRNKSGSIVNISSVAGIDGRSGMIGYVSSKAAIIGATKNMAFDLGKYNIRVNTIAPGLTDTDMGNIWNEEMKKEIISRQIFKRMARPEEIADAVVFLLSDMSSFITGQVIKVDGGGI